MSERCDHDPDSMILMHGETGDETFVFEPKSVICGKCSKTWTCGETDLRQALAAAQQAQREAEAERDLLQEYVTASDGHYCDGMAMAWSDAQEAIGKQVAAEAELRKLSDATGVAPIGLEFAEMLLQSFQRELDSQLSAAEAALTRAREALDGIVNQRPSEHDYFPKDYVKLMVAGSWVDKARAALEATQPRADDTPASGRQQSSSDA